MPRAVELQRERRRARREAYEAEEARASMGFTTTALRTPQMRPLMMLSGTVLQDVMHKASRAIGYAPSLRETAEKFNATLRTGTGVKVSFELGDSVLASVIRKGLDTPQQAPTQTPRLEAKSILWGRKPGRPAPEPEPEPQQKASPQQQLRHVQGKRQEQQQLRPTPDTNHDVPVLESALRYDITLRRPHMSCCPGWAVSPPLRPSPSWGTTVPTHPHKQQRFDDERELTRRPGNQRPTVVQPSQQLSRRVVRGSWRRVKRPALGRRSPVPPRQTQVLSPDAADLLELLKQPNWKGEPDWNGSDEDAEYIPVSVAKQLVTGDGQQTSYQKPH